MNKELFSTEFIFGEESFKAIAEILPQLAWTASPEGIPDWANGNWYNYTGLPKEKTATDKWESVLLHPDDFKRSLKIWRQCLRDGQVYETEFRLKRPDGVYRWFHCKAIPVKENNEVIKWLGTCTDIHEQKTERENRYKKEIDLFNRISNYIHYGIIIFEKFENQPLYVNNETLRILGVSKKEIQENGLPYIHDIIHPIDFSKIYSSFEGLKYSVTKEEHTIPLSFRLNKSEDEERHIKAKLLVLQRDVTGEPQLFVLLLEDAYETLGTHTVNKENIGKLPDVLELYDLEENKNIYVDKEVTALMEALEKINVELIKKNEELIRINNDLDSFIYTASHDLKAPVSNIEGLVNTLVDSLDQSISNDESVKVILDMMYQSIDRFKNTIADLTEISKIQRNITENISEEIHVESLIDDIKFMIREEIISSEAFITIQTSRLPVIRFSRKDLNSILYNLISNAIKYKSPERIPSIEVSTQLKGGYAVLSVKDNGLGIPSDKIDQIFQMFKRLHDHIEGTGIGLYIVKRIIDNSGGKIEVESEEGKGSVFHVYLPLL